MLVISLSLISNRGRMMTEATAVEARGEHKMVLREKFVQLYESLLKVLCADLY